MGIRSAGVRFLAPLLAVLAAAAFPVRADDVRSLFRDAAYLEEAVGDLGGALEAYRRVAADRTSSAELVAAARLRAGRCLELLSRPSEAAALYAAALRDTPAELASLGAEARRRLAALEPAASVDALIDRLESDDPDDRYRAIGALRAENPAQVAAALVRRLDREGPKARHYAVILLGHLKDPAAIPALRARLDDAVAEIRCNAALSLFKLGDRTGAATLRRELESPVAQVRSLAAAHLSHFGDKAAAPALVDDLASADPFVRSSAIQALARLYGEDLGFAADAPDEARAAALARWRERIK